MTLADYSIAAFALLNGARVMAYLPQIIRIHRDPNGATAVSLTTWSLFTASNAATIAYAVTVSGDLVVASVFGLNAMGCLIIVGLTATKRAPFGQPTGLNRLERFVAAVRQTFHDWRQWMPSLADFDIWPTRKLRVGDARAVN